MANLTITIDDDVLKRARIKALEQGTSVNALLREYLESYAGEAELRRAAMRRLVERARRSNTAVGTSGRVDLGAGAGSDGAGPGA